MKKELDTNFARAILILVGALIIFSFWFLSNSMNQDPVSKTSTNNPVQQQIVKDKAIQEQQAKDPVLKEVNIDDIVIETADDINGLDEISEIEDIDFSDVNF